MGGESPVVELYDSSGNPLSVQNGVAIPASTPALMLAGSDGTNSRYITVDSSGRVVLVGAGVAGTPAGGVVSIQGVSGGTTVTISGTVTADIGTTNGLALDTSVNGILLAQGSTTSGEKGPLVQGSVTTAAPAYTTGQTSPLSLTTSGMLRIDGSGVTQPVSGTVTANQGTANTLANAWSIKITDATNGPAAVKAASTAAVATDPALVVAISPNNPITTSSSLVPDRQVSGTISALNGTVTISAQGVGDLGVQITGTWSATLSFEGTIDGSNWYAVTATPIGIASTGITASSTTSNGQWHIMAAGSAQIRVRASAYTSGTATVSLEGNQGSSTVRSTVTGITLIDGYNSTTATLGSNAVFTGTGVDVSGYSTINISVFSDQSGTLSIQFSPDNTNWDIQTAYSITGGTASAFQIGPQSRYFRIIYTNGSVAQTAFRLQTLERTLSSSPATIPVSSIVDPEDDAILTKSVITGKTTAGGGAYVDVKVSPSGAVQVGGSIAITDATATNTAAVKAASTAAIATDQALVVAISPNNSVSSFTADVTNSGNLGALNATVQVTMAGLNGAGMQLATGTLVGTIVPEISLDGGTTWVGTFFESPTTGAIVSSIVFGSANTATTETIVGTGGASHVRVRVSLYTSGTAVCALRASQMNDPALIWTGPTNATAPPNAVQIAGKDATGKLQVPQVDKFLGGTVEQLSVAATLTSPNAAAAGIYAFPTSYGTIQVSNEPCALFNDPFSGSVIDTVNRWNVPVTSGVGASVTQNSGVLTLTASTTANAYASLTSQPTFINSGLGFIVQGLVVKIEAVAVTGQEKFWGIGTLASSPTSTAALTDAIGFEQDTTGVLSAVIYASGVKVFGQALTRPSDGGNHTYVFETRPDITLFYLDNFEVPAASIQFILPSIQALPFHMHVVNGATPSGAGTFTVQAAGMGDSAPNSISLSDGSYAWRKTTIKASATASSSSDTALVVTTSPNSPTIIGSDNIAPRIAFVDINGRLQVQDDNNRYILEQVINNQKNYGDLFVDVLSYIKNSLTSLSSSSSTSSSTVIGNIIYGNANQSITCTLTSLANNGQRQSSVINNSTNLFSDALVQVQIKTNAAGTSATGIVNIYVYSSGDGGVTYGDGAAGIDSAITLTSPPNITLIGSINTVANATTYKSNVMSVAAAFSGNLPQYWGIVVENKSGAALDATASNFKTFYQGIVN